MTEEKSITRFLEEAIEDESVLRFESMVMWVSGSSDIQTALYQAWKLIFDKKVPCLKFDFNNVRISMTRY